MENKPTITDEQKKNLYLALQCKSIEPGITYDDMYVGIIDIKHSYMKEMLVWSIPVVIVFLSSIYAIIFNQSSSDWYVTGLVGLILSSVGEFGVMIYCKKYMLAIISLAVSIFIGYVVINRSIDGEMLENSLQLIKGVFS